MVQVYTIRSIIITQNVGGSHLYDVVALLEKVRKLPVCKGLLATRQGNASYWPNGGGIQ